MLCSGSKDNAIPSQLCSCNILLTLSSTFFIPSSILQPSLKISILPWLKPSVSPNYDLSLFILSSVITVIYCSCSHCPTTFSVLQPYWVTCSSSNAPWSLDLRMGHMPAFSSLVKNLWVATHGNFYANCLRQ